MLEEILKVHQSGDLESAEARYREWLAFNPDDPEALHLLAVLLRQRNNLVEAISLARQAVDLIPERSTYRNTLGGLLLHARDFVNAREQFTVALRLDANQFGAALGLAQIATLQGDIEAARDALAKAAQISPGHPRVLAQQAGLAQARGDHQAAVKLFLEAAKRDGNDPAIHANLGRSFGVLGQMAFAEQAFRNALLIKPDYTMAQVTLGQLLARDGRPQEALAEFEQVLARLPEHALALAGKGDIQRLTGDLVNALDSYRKAYAAAPELPGLARSLVQTLLTVGLIDEGRQVLADALVRDPRDGDLQTVALHVAARESDEAYRQAIGSWLAVDPGNVIARESLALHLELRGEYDQADIIARETLKLDSRAAFARLLLARSALRNGAPDKAQEQINLVPVTGLSAPRRVERSQLRGLARDALEDHAGAVEAWIESHRQTEGEARLVSSPTAPAHTPTLHADAEADRSLAPVFLLGLPGAGMESLAALLAQYGVRVLTDRFGAEGRGDAIATGEYSALIDQAVDNPSTIEHFRDGYLLALSQLDESLRPNLVDWLPFVDARAIELLRAAFPSARFVLLQRDPRDCLLNWLSMGCRQYLAATEPEAMGLWLAGAHAHLAEVSRRLAGDQLITVAHDELNDVDAVASRLLGFLGLAGSERRRPFDVLAGRGGLPTSLPDGRWQAYDRVLTSAFGPLSAATTGN